MDGMPMYLVEVLPERKSFRLWKCPKCAMNHAKNSMSRTNEELSRASQA
jgi:ribosomal protein L37AE/L43A